VTISTSKNDFLDAVSDFKAGNVELALDKLQKLSDSGLTEATCYLGSIYETRPNAEVSDGERALEFYRKAASEGELRGYIGLARLHFRGRGVTRDMKKAFYYYSLVENRGYANGSMLVTLGRMYQFGWGVKKDENEAERYYRLASAVGNVYGRRYLGLLLIGKGRWVAGNIYSFWAVFSAYLIKSRDPWDDRLKEL
jgi:uncharacterized protein